MVLESLETQENDSISVQTEESNDKYNTSACETSDEYQQETDIFEVPAEKVTMKSTSKPCPLDDRDEIEPKSVGLSTESPKMLEPEESSLHELALKDDELKLLKAKLEDKENDLEVFRLENV
ncbi:uncharacterized protein LOC111375435 [Olea europaea var. sylvestris]|uniref:uncharacterized protein LOC111375435 n=1 Tax=Olea europaea var. sylvestris TaxID=158386 RepID=UPI000C1D81C0|nr:uncharacterized protein LOC111375435 [Olea europaea var. sylvestris]XP_022854024.1 uncharacterized protein LOC111375435 [Olea europaea var. sylvestris]XP_022854025.1 uncharacterized protein LOC111375435 [Olea europaea var. sylvestris]